MQNIIKQLGHTLALFGKNAFILVSELRNSCKKIKEQEFCAFSYLPMNNNPIVLLSFWNDLKINIRIKQFFFGN